MKKLLNKKFFTILSVIVFIFLIFSLFYKPKPALPKIISSLPSANSTSVLVTDPIQLKFDQPVDPSLLTVSSNPPEVWAIQSGDDNTIATLKSKQYLRAETPYSLSILYHNQPTFTLNFKTIPQQGDPRYTQGVLQEMSHDYPLAKFTPYETTQYLVVYSSPMTLEITLKSPNIPHDQAISDIRAWVTSVGGDATAHQYVIATQSPAPSK
jgi:methionine-rich copper-binding protein CopC